MEVVKRFSGPILGPISIHATFHKRNSSNISCTRKVGEKVALALYGSLGIFRTKPAPLYGFVSCPEGDFK